MTSRDRRAKVLVSQVVNGIDFVEIANQAQTLMRVHFLNAVAVEGAIGTPTITGGETIPTVPVLPILPSDWGWDDGHVVLTLRVAAPGDFSTYTPTLPGLTGQSPPPSTKLDPFSITWRSRSRPDARRTSTARRRRRPALR